MTMRNLAAPAIAFALIAAPVAALAGTKAQSSFVSPHAGHDQAKSIPRGLLRALERANEHGQKGIRRAIENRSGGC